MISFLPSKLCLLAQKKSKPTLLPKCTPKKVKDTVSCTYLFCSVGAREVTWQVPLPRGQHLLFGCIHQFSSVSGHCWLMPFLLTQCSLSLVWLWSVCVLLCAIPPPPSAGGLVREPPFWPCSLGGVWELSQLDYISRGRGVVNHPLHGRNRRWVVHHPSTTQTFNQQRMEVWL